MLYTDFASGIRWDKKPWTGVQLEEGRLISVWNIPTDRWTVTTGKIQGEDSRSSVYPNLGQKQKLITATPFNIKIV